MTQPALNIRLWNARGLVRVSEELPLFLSAHNIAHMRDGQRIYLPGYLIYHAYHTSGNSRGGSATRDRW